MNSSIRTTNTARRLFGVFSLCLIAVAVASCGSGEAENPTGNTQAAVANAGQSDTGNSAPPAAAAPANQNAPANAASFSGPDIGGIYIGMTPAQVEAAFQAGETPPTRSQTMQKTYRYSVLGQRMETEPFTSNLIAQTREPNSLVTLEAGVAPPPKGGKVMSARRQHRQDLQRLPRDQYRAALVEKYGPPTMEEEAQDGAESILTLTWMLSDGVQCVRHPFGVVIGDSVREKLRTPQGAMWNPEAQSEADCGNFLIYELRDDPVRLAQGVLWNVKADLAAQQATDEWISQLQEEASRPGSEVPSL